MVQFDTILLSIPFGAWVAKIMPSPYLRAWAASETVLSLHGVTALRRREILRLVEHVEPAGRARVLRPGEQRHLQLVDEGLARLLAGRPQKLITEIRAAAASLEQGRRIEASGPADCSSGLVATAASSWSAISVASFAALPIWLTPSGRSPRRSDEILERAAATLREAPAHRPARLP